MLRILVRLVADSALVAIALFVSARTLAWPRAWMLLGVMLVVRTVSALGIYRVRLEREERFLRRALPGYTEYAARVPHRLLPGIW